MKKGNRGIGILLAAAFAFTVCSCGKPDAEILPGGGLQQEDLVEENKEAASIPEEKRFVCALEEFELGSFGAGGTGTTIRQAVRSGDRIYLFATVDRENDAPESCSGLKVISVKEDGSDLKQIEPAYETAPEDANAIVSFAHFHVGKNGNLYAVRNVLETDKDGLIKREETYVCCWDREGELFWESPLPNLRTADNDTTHINSLICLPDGNVALLTGGHDIGKFLVDADGNVSELLPMGDYTEAFQNPFSMLPRDDGTMLIVYFVSGGPGMGMVEFNVATDTVGDKIMFPENVTWRNVDRVAQYGQNGLLYSNAEGLFRYHAGDEDPLQVMNYFNSDLVPEGFTAFFPLESGKILTFFEDYHGGKKLRGGLLSRKAPEDIPDKELLTLGGINIGSDVYRDVVAYNRGNETMRILIRDYAVYNSAANNGAGYDKLDEDILSGNMPDILLLNNDGFSKDEYIAKGLFADVDALLEKDAGLSAADFRENVFDACRVDGKLYEVVPGYRVKTYAGRADRIGANASLTMAEAKDLLADMPEGTRLLDADRTELILAEIVTFDYADLLDRSTLTCNFNTKEFQALLEFAKEAEEADPSAEALLVSLTIGDPEFANAQLVAEYGSKKMTFAGFPVGKSGSQGSVVQTPFTFALSAQSEHKDAAWEFVRSYLSEEYQSQVSGMLPVSKKCFEEMAAGSTGTYIADMISLCETVSKRSGTYGGVWEILVDETEPYFKGKRSASDVSAIIQSQVQTYLDGRK